MDGLHRNPPPNSGSSDEESDDGDWSDNGQGQGPSSDEMQSSNDEIQSERASNAEEETATENSQSIDAGNDESHRETAPIDDDEVEREIPNHVVINLEGEPRREGIVVSLEEERLSDEREAENDTTVCPTVAYNIADDNDHAVEHTEDSVESTKNVVKHTKDVVGDTEYIVAQTEDAVEENTPQPPESMPISSEDVPRNDIVQSTLLMDDDSQSQNISVSIDEILLAQPEVNQYRDDVYHYCHPSKVIPYQDHAIPLSQLEHERPLGSPLEYEGVHNMGTSGRGDESLSQNRRKEQRTAYRHIPMGSSMAGSRTEDGVFATGSRGSMRKPVIGGSPFAGRMSSARSFRGVDSSGSVANGGGEPARTYTRAFTTRLDRVDRRKEKSSRNSSSLNNDNTNAYIAKKISIAVTAPPGTNKLKDILEPRSHSAVPSKASSVSSEGGKVNRPDETRRTSDRESTHDQKFVVNNYRGNRQSMPTDVKVKKATTGGKAITDGITSKIIATIQPKNARKAAPPSVKAKALGSGFNPGSQGALGLQRTSAHRGSEKQKISEMEARARLNRGPPRTPLRGGQDLRNSKQEANVNGDSAVSSGFARDSMKDSAGMTPRGGSTGEAKAVDEKVTAGVTTLSNGGPITLSNVGVTMVSDDHRMKSVITNPAHHHAAVSPYYVDNTFTHGNVVAAENATHRAPRDDLGDPPQSIVGDFIISRTESSASHSMAPNLSEIQCDGNKFSNVGPTIGGSAFGIVTQNIGGATLTSIRNESPSKGGTLNQDNYLKPPGMAPDSTINAGSSNVGVPISNVNSNVGSRQDSKAQSGGKVLIGTANRPGLPTRINCSWQKNTRAPNQGRNTANFAACVITGPRMEEMREGIVYRSIRATSPGIETELLHGKPKIITPTSVSMIDMDGEHAAPIGGGEDQKEVGIEGNDGNPRDPVSGTSDQRGPVDGSENKSPTNIALSPLPDVALAFRDAIVQQARLNSASPRFGFVQLGGLHSISSYMENRYPIEANDKAPKGSGTSPAMAMPGLPGPGVSPATAVFNLKSGFGTFGQATERSGMSPPPDVAKAQPVVMDLTMDKRNLGDPLPDHVAIRAGRLTQTEIDECKRIKEEAENEKFDKETNWFLRKSATNNNGSISPANKPLNASGALLSSGVIRNEDCSKAKIFFPLQDLIIDAEGIVDEDGNPVTLFEEDHGDDSLHHQHLVALAKSHQIVVENLAEQMGLEGNVESLGALSPLAGLSPTRHLEIYREHAKHRKTVSCLLSEAIDFDVAEDGVHTEEGESRRSQRRSLRKQPVRSRTTTTLMNMPNRVTAFNFDPKGGKLLMDVTEMISRVSGSQGGTECNQKTRDWNESTEKTRVDEKNDGRATDEENDAPTRRSRPTTVGEGIGIQSPTLPTAQTACQALGIDSRKSLLNRKMDSSKPLLGRSLKGDTGTEYADHEDDDFVGKDDNLLRTYDSDGNLLDPRALLSPASPEEEDELQDLFGKSLGIGRAGSPPVLMSPLDVPSKQYTADKEPTVECCVSKDSGSRASSAKKYGEDAITAPDAIKTSASGKGSAMPPAETSRPVVADTRLETHRAKPVVKPDIEAETTREETFEQKRLTPTPEKQEPTPTPEKHGPTPTSEKQDAKSEPSDIAPKPKETTALESTKREEIIPIERPSASDSAKATAGGETVAGGMTPVRNMSKEDKTFKGTQCKVGKPQDTKATSEKADFGEIDEDANAASEKSKKSDLELQVTRSVEVVMPQVLPDGSVRPPKAAWDGLQEIHREILFIDQMLQRKHEREGYPRGDYYAENHDYDTFAKPYYDESFARISRVEPHGKTGNFVLVLGKAGPNREDVRVVEHRDLDAKLRDDVRKKKVGEEKHHHVRTTIHAAQKKKIETNPSHHQQLRKSLAHVELLAQAHQLHAKHIALNQLLLKVDRLNEVDHHIVDVDQGAQKKLYAQADSVVQQIVAGKVEIKPKTPIGYQAETGDTVRAGSDQSSAEYEIELSSESSSTGNQKPPITAAKPSPWVATNPTVPSNVGYSTSVVSKETNLIASNVAEPSLIASNVAEPSLPSGTQFPTCQARTSVHSYTKYPRKHHGLPLNTGMPPQILDSMKDEHERLANRDDHHRPSLYHREMKSMVLSHLPVHHTEHTARKNSRRIHGSQTWDPANITPIQLDIQHGDEHPNRSKSMRIVEHVRERKKAHNEMTRQLRKSMVHTIQPMGLDQPMGFAHGFAHSMGLALGLGVGGFGYHNAPQCFPFQSFLGPQNNMASLFAPQRNMLSPTSTKGTVLDQRDALGGGSFFDQRGGAAVPPQGGAYFDQRGYYEQFNLHLPHPTMSYTDELHYYLSTFGTSGSRDENAQLHMIGKEFFPDVFVVGKTVLQSIDSPDGSPGGTQLSLKRSSSISGDRKSFSIDGDKLQKILDEKRSVESDKGGAAKKKTAKSHSPNRETVVKKLSRKGVGNKGSSAGWESSKKGVSQQSLKTGESQKSVTEAAVSRQNSRANSASPSNKNSARKLPNRSASNRSSDDESPKKRYKKSPSAQKVADSKGIYGSKDHPPDSPESNAPANSTGTEPTSGSAKISTPADRKNNSLLKVSAAKQNNRADSRNLNGKGGMTRQKGVDKRKSINKGKSIEQGKSTGDVQVEPAPPKRQSTLERRHSSLERRGSSLQRRISSLVRRRSIVDDGKTPAELFADPEVWKYGDGFAEIGKKIRETRSLPPPRPRNQLISGMKAGMISGSMFGTRNQVKKIFGKGRINAQRASSLDFLNAAVGTTGVSRMLTPIPNLVETLKSSGESPLAKTKEKTLFDLKPTFALDFNRMMDLGNPGAKNTLAGIAVGRKSVGSSSFLWQSKRFSVLGGGFGNFSGKNSLSTMSSKKIDSLSIATGMDVSSVVLGQNATSPLGGPLETTGLSGQIGLKSLIEMHSTKLRGVITGGARSNHLSQRNTFGKLGDTLVRKLDDNKLGNNLGNRFSTLSRGLTTIARGNQGGCGATFMVGKSFAGPNRMPHQVGPGSPMNLPSPMHSMSPNYPAPSRGVSPSRGRIASPHPSVMRTREVPAEIQQARSGIDKIEKRLSNYYANAARHYDEQRHSWSRYPYQQPAQGFQNQHAFQGCDGADSRAYGAESGALRRGVSAERAGAASRNVSPKNVAVSAKAASVASRISEYVKAPIPVAVWNVDRADDPEVQDHPAEFPQFLVASPTSQFGTFQSGIPLSINPGGAIHSQKMGKGASGGVCTLETGPGRHCQRLQIDESEALDVKRVNSSLDDEEYRRLLLAQVEEQHDHEAHALIAECRNLMEEFSSLLTKSESPVLYRGKKRQADEADQSLAMKGGSKGLSRQDSSWKKGRKGSIPPSASRGASLMKRLSRERFNEKNASKERQGSERFNEKNASKERQGSTSDERRRSLSNDKKKRRSFSEEVSSKVTRLRNSMVHIESRMANQRSDLLVTLKHSAENEKAFGRRMAAQLGSPTATPAENGVSDKHFLPPQREREYDRFENRVELAEQPGSGVSSGKDRNNLGVSVKKNEYSRMDPQMDKIKASLDDFTKRYIQTVRDENEKRRLVLREPEHQINAKIAVAPQDVEGVVVDQNRAISKEINVSSREHSPMHSPKNSLISVDRDNLQDNQQTHDHHEYRHAADHYAHTGHLKLLDIDKSEETLSKLDAKLEEINRLLCSGPKNENFEIVTEEEPSTKSPKPHSSSSSAKDIPTKSAKDSAKSSAAKLLTAKASVTSAKFPATKAVTKAAAAKTGRKSVKASAKTPRTSANAPVRTTQTPKQPTSPAKTPRKNSPGKGIQSPDKTPGGKSTGSKTRASSRGKSPTTGKKSTTTNAGKKSTTTTVGKKSTTSGSSKKSAAKSPSSKTRASSAQKRAPSPGKTFDPASKISAESYLSQNLHIEIESTTGMDSIGGKEGDGDAKTKGELEAEVYATKFQVIETVVHTMDKIPLAYEKGKWDPLKKCYVYSYILNGQKITEYYTPMQEIEDGVSKVEGDARKIRENISNHDLKSGRVMRQLDFMGGVGGKGPWS